MFEDLKGKKLLVLGCTKDDCQIIDAAKSMGVYTITTDNHTDWSLAPAKYLSDEAWDISWADIETLKEKSILSGIDGVMAGYSEFRIDSAIKLSKEIGTPFYAEDEEVLEKTFDKRIFKDICMKYNVPVTKDYFVDWDNYDEWVKTVKFPVVIKPADNAGSRGIRTCYCPDELRNDIDYALSFSNSHNIVIEELIKGGREVVIYYTMADGEIVLSAMCDKFERVVGDGFNSLPDVYFYPSSNINSYTNLHNNNVIKALKEMGMKDGAANLQGFVKKDGTFVFFEMDFRPGGTNTYHFTEYYSDVNYLKMMISYSLTGNIHKEELVKEDPTFRGNYGCIFTLLSHDGIITEQSGEEIVASWPNVLHTCFYHSIGTKIEVNGSQFPKTFRAYIVGDNVEEIKSTIKKIQEVVTVKDQYGRNMLFPEFDVDLLNIYKRG
ncbi:MAG: ATP-grasp domain-containing protein [Erysipelotrichia bacterium]|nr:ATP-grasp domain-containing protein [Erysipelotrichia bacterium]